MSRITTAYQVLRHFGPKWVGFRAKQTLKQRFKWYERTLPRSGWKAYSLATILTDPSLATEEAFLKAWKSSTPRFFFTGSEVKEFRSVLSRFGEVPESADLHNGVFTLFSFHKVEAGLPPDWHKNQVTGEQAPGDIHWSRIPDFGFGDIKGIWELSRFPFVFKLARAYARTGDEAHPELFWKLIESWRSQNLPNSGVNWKCGQETTFRVMAWLFGLYGFSESKAATPARIARLAEMIAFSGYRIEGHIDYAISQRNNHSISEAVGLYTIGLLFPQFKKSAEWKRKGRGLLERLASELIYSDGAFSQHSANYHRVMLHDLLWSLRLADLNNEPFSSDLKSQFAKAANFIFQIQDAGSGKVPCYGQNDGALILPLSRCDYTDFRPIVQACFFYLELKRVLGSGEWDEDLIWFFGKDALKAPHEARERQKVFVAPEGGCTVIREGNSFAFLRCSRYKDRPSQADQLHMDLWIDGEEVACDAGTYSYNAPPPWHLGLGGTRFHNTVSVNDADQMKRVGKFMWLPWAQGKVEDIQSLGSGKILWWKGQHTGYSTSSEQVVHSRSVVLLSGIGWLVLDKVSGTADKEIELHWLLNKMEERNGGTNSMLLKANQSSLNLNWASTKKPTLKVETGSSSALDGWRSSYYYHLQPAHSLRIRLKGKNERFATLFSREAAMLEMNSESLHLRTGHTNLIFQEQGSTLIITDSSRSYLESATLLVQ